MKKLLYVLVAILVLLGLGVVAINAYLNSGKVKQLAIEQVKQHLARDLSIDGDLSLSIYPSLGLQIENVALKDHPSFSAQDTLSVESLVVSVQLMPLLSERLLIDKILLQKPSIRFVTNEQGITNFDDLKSSSVPTGASEPESEPATDGDEQSPAWEVVVSELAIEDGQLVIEQNKQRTLVGPLQLSINGQGLGKTNSLILNTPIEIEQSTVELSLTTQIIPALDLNKVELETFSLALLGKGDMFVGGKLDAALSAKGALNIKASQLALNSIKLRADKSNSLNGNLQLNYAGKPNLAFSFASKELNLKPYMASTDKTTKSDGTASSESEQAPKGQTGDSSSSQEPDLSVLQSFDMNGTLEIDSLIIPQTTLSSVLAQINVNSGVLNLTNLKAKMFSGTLATSAQVDSNVKPHTAAVKLDVKSVAARPMLKAFADFDKLSGNLAISADVETKGLSSSNVRSSLSGPYAFTFSDGAYHGINIAEMIRKAKAALTGQASAADSKNPKTDFSELLLQGNFAKQQAVVSKAKMSSPLLRIDGKGSTHLVNETINFGLVTKVVASLEGQGGANDLEGISIPLNIKGSWSEPKFELDMQKLLEGNAKKEIQNRLEKELGLDGADDSDPKKQILKSLGGLLGG